MDNTKKDLHKEDKILREYAEVKKAISELGEKQKELEPQVLNALSTIGVDTLQETYGTFSKVFRKVWKYSEAYNQKEEQYQVILKAERDKEQQDKIATFEEKVGLSYRVYEVKE